MNEKRFTLSNFASPSQLSDVCDDGGKMLNSEVVDLLNEQQDQINSLILSIKAKDRHIKNQQAAIRRLQDICGKSDGENAKLRIENEQLRKEIKQLNEDEKLYAKEIVRLNKNIEELNKTIEEALKFKSLGGDY